MYEIIELQIIFSLLLLTDRDSEFCIVKTEPVKITTLHVEQINNS